MYPGLSASVGYEPPQHDYNSPGGEYSRADLEGFIGLGLG